MSYASPQYDPDGQLHLVPPHHSFWGGAAKGALVAGILAATPRPIRRWCLIFFALSVAIFITAESPHEWWTPESGVRYGEGGVFAGYRFPWFCWVLVVAWVLWCTVGLVRAFALARQCHAVGDTPVQRFRARMNSRVLIAVDGTQRPPQSPTGPSQRPTAPPPAPPMGSNLPATYAPTYWGPKRIETGLSGIVIRDYRSVDPEDL